MRFPDDLSLGTPRLAGIRVDYYLNYLRRYEGLTPGHDDEEAVLSDESHLRKILQRSSLTTFNAALLRTRKVSRRIQLPIAEDGSRALEHGTCFVQSNAAMLHAELSWFAMEGLSKTPPRAPQSLKAVKKALATVCEKVPSQGLGFTDEEVLLPSILKTQLHSPCELLSIEPRTIRRRPKKVLISSFAANMWFDLEMLREKIDGAAEEHLDDAFDVVLARIVPASSANPIQCNHSGLVVEHQIMPQICIVTLLAKPKFTCSLPEARLSCPDAKFRFLCLSFAYLTPLCSVIDCSLPSQAHCADFGTCLKDYGPRVGAERTFNKVVLKEPSALYPFLTIEPFICKRYFDHRRTKTNDTKRSTLLIDRKVVARGGWVHKALWFGKHWRKKVFSENSTILCESSNEMLRAGVPLHSIIGQSTNTPEIWLQEELQALKTGPARNVEAQHIATSVWAHLRSRRSESRFVQWPENALKQQIQNFGSGDELSVFPSSGDLAFEEVLFQYDAPSFPQDPFVTSAIVRTKQTRVPKGGTWQTEIEQRTKQAILVAQDKPFRLDSGRNSHCNNLEKSVEAERPLLNNEIELDPVLDLDVDPLGFHGIIARDQNTAGNHASKENGQKPNVLEQQHPGSIKFERECTRGNDVQQQLSRKKISKPRPTQVIVPENMIASKFSIDLADKSLRRRSALLLPPPLSPIASLCIVTNTYLQMTGCDHRCLWLHFGPAADFDFAFRYFTDVLHSFTISKDPDAIHRTSKNTSPHSRLQGSVSGRGKARPRATARVLFSRPNLSSIQCDLNTFSFIVVAIGNNFDDLEAFLRKQRMMESSHGATDTIVFVPSGPRTKLKDFLRALKKIPSHFSLNEAILWDSKESGVAISVTFQYPNEIRLVTSVAVKQFGELLEQITVAHRDLFANIRRTQRTTATPKLTEIPQNDIEEAIRKLKQSADLEEDEVGKQTNEEIIPDGHNHSSLQQLVELHVMKNLMFHIFNDGVPVARNFLAHAREHYVEVHSTFFHELDSRISQLILTSHSSHTNEHTSSITSTDVPIAYTPHPKLHSVLDIIECEKKRMECEDRSISAGRICRTFQVLIISGSSLGKDVLQQEIEASLARSAFISIADHEELLLAESNSSNGLEFYSGFSLIVILANEYGPDIPLPTTAVQLAHANALRFVFVSADSEEPSVACSRVVEHDIAVGRARKLAGSMSNVVSLLPFLQSDYVA